MKVQKLIGTLAIFSVLIILSIGIIPPSSNNEAITTTYESNVNFDDYDDDDLIDYGYFDEIGLIDSELSIIDTERVFTESDQSLVEQFLDESGLPSSSEKLGIEVQTVLFDSDQKQYPTSNIVGIPELSVTDEQGRVLDLGTIQTSFLAISAKTEQQFNLEGTVKFYLDDDLIATKKIYGSDNNKQNHELSILDSLPPTSFDRPKAFTFTLSDEGRDWEDKSEHTYRVVLTEVNANLDSNKDFKQFSWNGENIVYELKVKVDEQKKVVLDNANNAVSIFKDDSTIQICGMSTLQEIPYKGWQQTKTDSPIVTVKIPMTRNIQSIPVPFIVISDFEPQDPKKPSFGSNHWFGNLSTLSSCTEKIDGIPRNTNIIIELDYADNTRDKKYELKTPLSQKNYYVYDKLGFSKYMVEGDNGKIISNAYSVSYGGTESNFISENELSLLIENQNVRYTRSITQNIQE